jgi:hypothetical protein
MHGVQTGEGKPRLMLESVRLPGGHRVTDEALDRFLEAIDSLRAVAC